jgi:aminopeptidase-like protein
MNLNKLIKEELSGNTAKSYVAQICRFHRIQGSPMFHEAAEYVKNELLKMGLQDASIEQFPADGKTKYWTYTSPVGWEINSAELRLIEPEDKLLCTYEDNPQSLHVFSNYTPPEGITAELVDVGAGTKPKDYEGKDVKGKFVLATGRARLVHEQAVYKFGAAGVITDAVTYEMPNVRESLDIPDAHAYQAIWPTAEQLDKIVFGFSLSKRQGNALRALVRNGKTVKLKAKIDARLFAGNEEIVTATIQGTSKPDETIFLIAHLCHPKPCANDNASGSGLLLEIVRTIKALINSGRIFPPMRTLRFMWVPETLGTIAYLSKHEEIVRSKFVAGINLDMVGQNQELCKSTLSLDRTPDSLPSYLNDFVFDVIEQSVKEFDTWAGLGSSSTFRYRTGAFVGASDHAEFTNSTTGVPCVMLLQWPDLYYHTSMDTIDKVSEDSLKRVGWITAVAALTLTNATTETAFQLTNQTVTRGIARLQDAEREAIQELFKKKEDPKIKDKPEEIAKEITKTASYYKAKLEHVSWREQEAIKSTRKLAQDTELDSIIEKYRQDIAVQGHQAKARVDEAVSFFAKALTIIIPAETEEASSEELKKLIPKRLFKGSLSDDVLKKELGEEAYSWYQEIDEKDKDFDKKMAEIINFMDGKRNAYAILLAISAEYSPTDPEHMLRFLRDLEKTKLITL